MFCFSFVLPSERWIFLVMKCLWTSLQPTGGRWVTSAHPGKCPSLHPVLIISWLFNAQQLVSPLSINLPQAVVTVSYFFLDTSHAEKDYHPIPWCPWPQFVWRWRSGVCIQSQTRSWRSLLQVHKHLYISVYYSWIIFHYLYYLLLEKYCWRKPRLGPRRNHGGALTAQGATLSQI